MNYSRPAGESDTETPSRLLPSRPGQRATGCSQNVPPERPEATGWGGLRPGAGQEGPRAPSSLRLAPPRSPALRDVAHSLTGPHLPRSPGGAAERRGGQSPRARLVAVPPQRRAGRGPEE